MKRVSTPAFSVTGAEVTLDASPWHANAMETEASGAPPPVSGLALGFMTLVGLQIGWTSIKRNLLL